MDQQHAKEKACRLGLLRGIALFTRGHQVFGVYADGTTVLVCGGRHSTDLWPKTLAILARDDEILSVSPPPCVLRTPAGTFVANSVSSLVLRWLSGRRAGLPPPPDESR